MREIMIALDNVGTLDIPHRLLLTNIHGESVGKADVGDALVQIPAFFNALGHSGDPFIDESALLGDVILRDHGAVAGNNVIHIFQRFQEIQAFQQSVNVGGMQPGLAAGKDGITHKSNPLLRHMDAGLGVRMSRSVIQEEIRVAHFRVMRSL